MILRYKHILKQQFPVEDERFYADLSQTIVAAIVTYAGLVDRPHPQADVPDIDLDGNPLGGEIIEEDPGDFLVGHPRGDRPPDPPFRVGICRR